MVWKISNKEKVDPKDTQRTAVIGLTIIVGLSILAWAIEHIRII
tara:strand:- start:147 stop:278 length:132 start_codon:yes stop_codon:yes gene_type:complete